MSDGAPSGGPGADATIATALFDAGTAHQLEAADDLVEAAVEALRHHLDMDVAFMSEFRGGRRLVTVVDSDDDFGVSPDGPAPIHETFSGRVADGTLPPIVADASDLPTGLGSTVQEGSAIGSAVSVPIELPDGRTFGALSCLDAEPDPSLNARDLAVMRIFADMIAESIGSERRERRRRNRLRESIADAIAGDALSVVFQPIVDLRLARPIGYEALARFGGDGDTSPERWFRDAAESGMSVELELAALERAVASLPALPSDAYLSLNVSSQVVISGRLATALADVPPERIVVEITEHEAVPAYDDLASSLTWLRREGVSVAVDDAGAGFASFRHILQLRPDVIKLDMSITRDVDSDPGRRALASAFVAFARDTGSVIVAEGVETEAEIEALDELGVLAAQGFELGRPGPLPGS